MARRLARAILIALIILIALSFPFGPLFPWSPWKPGYSHLALKRADVYYPAGTNLPDAFRDLDGFIADSEQFHRLKVDKRIRVILCRSWSDFYRFMPTQNAVGGATLETGTVIYITPRIAERGLDFGEFLRHELSHATVSQHQTLAQAHAAPSKAQWLFEGLAVSFGRQKAYVTPYEFVVFSRARDLVSVIDPAKRRPDLPWDMRYNYQVWRYFLEYLIDSSGRDRLQTLLTAMMRDPAGSEQIFANTYGAPMPVAVRSFQADLAAGKWSPRP